MAKLEASLLIKTFEHALLNRFSFRRVLRFHVRAAQEHLAKSIYSHMRVFRRGSVVKNFWTFQLVIYAHDLGLRVLRHIHTEHRVKLVYCLWPLPPLDLNFRLWWVVLSIHPPIGCFTHLKKRSCLHSLPDLMPGPLMPIMKRLKWTPSPWDYQFLAHNISLPRRVYEEGANWVISPSPTYCYFLLTVRDNLIKYLGVSV